MVGVVVVVVVVGEVAGVSVVLVCRGTGGRCSSRSSSRCNSRCDGSSV